MAFRRQWEVQSWDGKIVARFGTCTGLSQMQLQKFLEQYQKIPKSVVVQHKIGVP